MIELTKFKLKRSEYSKIEDFQNLLDSSGEKYKVIVDSPMCMKTKGEISGGTWASFIYSISSGSRVIDVNKTTNSKKVKTKKIFYNKELKQWALIFPVIDKQIIYRTSKKFKEYGSEFSFNEYMLIKSLFQLLILIKGVILIGMFSRFKFIKN